MCFYVSIFSISGEKDGIQFEFCHDCSFDEAAMMDEIECVLAGDLH
jgi:hypothetical protein